MSHEDLIVTLASLATPVKRLPAPAVRMARWVLLASLVVGVGIAWRGLRQNWAAALVDPSFIVTTVLIVLVALLAAWATFALAVPGALRSPIMKWAPLAALGLWGVVLIQQVGLNALVPTLFGEPVVAGCMWKTYGIAVGPALIIILLARRAAPLDWRWTGGLAALSALAFGVVGTELICPVTRHVHLFSWHFLPVVGMTILAFCAGSIWPRRH